MLNFRTAGWCIFLSSLWYKPHLYFFKKSLIWTDIEKTAPENISECSAVSLSEYELKKLCTRLRPYIWIGTEKRTLSWLRRESPQLIFL